MATPTTYSYSVSQDTKNHKVNVDSLTKEIASSAIIIAVSYISIFGDVLSVVMKDALSEGDINLLDNIITAHEGIPLNIPSLIQFGNDDGETIESVDGKPLIAQSPGIDPSCVCFCKGVSGEFSVITPYVEWQIDEDYVQLQGASVVVKGAEEEDKLHMEVGMKVSENWVPITRYGDGITILENIFHFDHDAAVRSNPIPRGLWLRAVLEFKNSQTTNKPKISLVYHLWRPYA